MHTMHERKLSAVDLNSLVVLRALLKTRHVTRAAREVGLSQSATSHALSRLRELYGDPLLVRSGRSLELTPRAAALLPKLERGLHELAEALRDEEPFDPARAKLTLRLGAVDYGQSVLLAPLLALLRKEAPGIDLQVMSYPNFLAALEAGDIDLAHDREEKLPSSFSERRVFSDRFMCMLRKDHPALRRKLSLKSYLELEHVVVAPGGLPGSPIDTALERRGLTRHVALQVSSFLVAPQVVAETDMINTGPERLLRRMSAHYPVVLTPCPLPMPRFDLCLVWLSRRDHEPALAWLCDAIARVSKRL